MRKINWKRILVISYWLLVIGLLVYSRFVNLGWGLPYPMHPDERNMATAIQQLHCQLAIVNWQLTIRNCFNPHFFAYGQFPLYLAYLIIWGYKGMLGVLGRLGSVELRISFVEAVMALRTISAFSAVFTAFVTLGILGRLGVLRVLRDKKQTVIALLLIIFSPALIQFAHFGTTESLLMLFYSLIVYLCLLYQQKKLPISNFLLLTSLFSGLAIATKISSLLFLFLPAIVLIANLLRSHQSRILTIKQIIKFLGLSLFFAVLFSPHNIINYRELLNSMDYESAVATGSILVFYTRQFINTVPILFQFLKVFPYALGWPVFILFLFGFIFLPWKREINLLRFAFVAYFIPQAFLFSKWTRFMSPILPVMLVIATLFLFKMYSWIWSFVSEIKSKVKNQKSKIQIKNQKFLFLIYNFAFCLLTFAFILPGIAYLSIYQNEDVRFKASEWIYNNIPEGSYILSETANVVDIPLQIQNSEFRVQNYKVISFNFYNLDEDKILQEELKENLKKADYIFIPSRRIFANINNHYPKLKEYYQKLFNGELGFKKVAEFSNSWLSDEQAEETWTVFDHPVVRIYRRL